MKLPVKLLRYLQDEGALKERVPLSLPDDSRAPASLRLRAGLTDGSVFIALLLKNLDPDVVATSEAFASLERGFKQGIGSMPAVAHNWTLLNQVLKAHFGLELEQPTLDGLSNGQEDLLEDLLTEFKTTLQAKSNMVESVPTDASEPKPRRPSERREFVSGYSRKAGGVPTPSALRQAALERAVKSSLLDDSEQEPLKNVRSYKEPAITSNNVPHFASHRKRSMVESEQEGSSLNPRDSEDKVQNKREMEIQKRIEENRKKDEERRKEQQERRRVEDDNRRREREDAMSPDRSLTPPPARAPVKPVPKLNLPGSQNTNTVTAGSRPSISQNALAHSPEKNSVVSLALTAPAASLPFSDATRLLKELVRMPEVGDMPAVMSFVLALTDRPELLEAAASCLADLATSNRTSKLRDWCTGKVLSKTVRLLMDEEEVDATVGGTSVGEIPESVRTDIALFLFAVHHTQLLEFFSEILPASTGPAFPATAAQVLERFSQFGEALPGITKASPFLSSLALSLDTKKSGLRLMSALASAVPSTRGEFLKKLKTRPNDESAVSCAVGMFSGHGRATEEAEEEDEQRLWYVASSRANGVAFEDQVITERECFGLMLEILRNSTGAARDVGIDAALQIRRKDSRLVAFLTDTDGNKHQPVKLIHWATAKERPGRSAGSASERLAKVLNFFAEFDGPISSEAASEITDFAIAAAVAGVRTISPNWSVCVGICIDNSDPDRFESALRGALELWVAGLAAEADGWNVNTILAAASASSSGRPFVMEALGALAEASVGEDVLHSKIIKALETLGGPTSPEFVQAPEQPEFLYSVQDDEEDDPRAAARSLIGKIMANLDGINLAQFGGGI